MAHDVVEHNIQTGKTTTRDYTQAEKDAIADSIPTNEHKWKRMRQERNPRLK